MKRLNAIHPGWISSRNDGDWHYITYNKLIRLYNLNPRDCVLWDDKVPATFIGRNKDNYKHFYPLYSGDYHLYEGKGNESIEQKTRG